MTEAKKRTEGYRIWLTADTVEQIQGLAQLLNIDHKRMMAVWVVEMLAQKAASVRMAETIADRVAQVVGDGMNAEVAGLQQLLAEHEETDEKTT